MKFRAAQFPLWTALRIISVTIRQDSFVVSIETKLFTEYLLLACYCGGASSIQVIASLGNKECY
jgi:hypothetical protein